MQNIADRWLEMAERNHLTDPATAIERVLDPAESRRAIAWETVAQRYTPGALQFRW